MVDDHERLRGLIANGIAKRLAATVDQAGDVTQLLQALETRAYDAIASDVSLPGQTSLDALGSIRAVAPVARIVLMSAAPGPDLAGRALAAGADAFVPKSAGLEELCRALVPDIDPDSTTGGPRF